MVLKKSGLKERRKIGKMFSMEECLHACLSALVDFTERGSVLVFTPEFETNMKFRGADSAEISIFQKKILLLKKACPSNTLDILSLDDETLFKCQAAMTLRATCLLPGGLPPIVGSS